MKHFFTLSLLLLSSTLLLPAQTVLPSASQRAIVYTKYWVQFRDKANNTYSLSRPLEFLSPRALDRRAKYDIRLDSTDLPLTESYVQAVANTGATIHSKSKWLNAVTIQTSNDTILNTISALPFVASVSPVAAVFIQSTNDAQQQQSIVKVCDSSSYYGGADNQVTMVNGDYLHNLGYWGEGMQIAVLDAGFTNADKIAALDSLRDNSRILGTWDFVNNNENVYHLADHGRNVLSIIAGNQPGTYVGSAPRASYYLFVTEDVASEFKVEEGNWIAAAEYADSVGVDMITTSLGYTTFDDNSMSYTYSNMNGHTARISQGANAAANKGILVVSSAGNEGTSNWHYISAPADADSVMAVGAVNPVRQLANFSSRGPAYGGAVKPNVAGQGQSTAYIDANGNVAYGNGTSYSGPLIAGFTACLWQADRTKNNMDIIQLVQHTASIANHPNDSIGYGIPDYEKALTELLKEKIGSGIYDVENYPLAYPNPFSSNLNMMLFTSNGGEYDIDVFDSRGSRVYHNIINFDAERFYKVDLSDLNTLLAGMYLIRVHNNTTNKITRVVKF